MGKQRPSANRKAGRRALSRIKAPLRIGTRDRTPRNAHKDDGGGRREDPEGDDTSKEFESFGTLPANIRVCRLNWDAIQA